MKNNRLKKQIKFIIEIDKLKQVYRQTYLMDGSRTENDAEHSWHLAIMAILLSEYSKKKNLDILHTLKMVLVHDLIEIATGDTFCYANIAEDETRKREQNAANKIFKNLPSDQAEELRNLWMEFEERVTPEARFAAALDRFQPLLHNYNTRGKAWKKHKVTSDMVFKRNKHIQEGAPMLWNYAMQLIKDSIKKGYLVSNISTN